MILITNDEDLKSVKDDLKDIEDLLETKVTELPMLAIKALESSHNELAESLEAYEKYNDKFEPQGDVEDVITFFFNKWEPRCAHPGCTDAASVICFGMKPDGERAVSSLCDAHAIGKQKYLVEKAGFFSDPSGAFVNVKNIQGIMDDTVDSINKTRAVLTEDDDTPADAVSVKAGDIVVGDQMWDEESGWFKVLKIERARADGSPMPPQDENTPLGDLPRKDDRITFTFDGVSLMHEAGYPHFVRAVALVYDAISIGDMVLMPDNEIWCTVEDKDHGMLLWDTGFSQMKPGKTMKTRRTGARP